MMAAIRDPALGPGNHLGRPLDRADGVGSRPPGAELQLPGAGPPPTSRRPDLGIAARQGLKYTSAGRRGNSHNPRPGSVEVPPAARPATLGWRQPSLY